MAKSWGFSVIAATLSPLANRASRVFWGWASIASGAKTMIFTFVMQAFCLVGVATLGQLSSAWFAAARRGVLSWGQIYSLFPSTSGDYFGTRHATSNYAVLYTAKGVASIIGGYAAALLYEQSGSWAMGFYGSAVMALVAAVLAYGLRSANVAAKARAARPGARMGPVLSDRPDINSHRAAVNRNALAGRKRNAQFGVTFTNGFAVEGFASEAERDSAFAKPTMFRTTDQTLRPRDSARRRPRDRDRHSNLHWTGLSMPPAAEPLLVVPSTFIALMPRVAWQSGPDTRRIPVGGWLKGCHASRVWACCVLR